MPGVLFCDSLNEAKISKESRSMKICTASYASALSLSTGFLLYSLQTSCAFPLALKLSLHLTSTEGDLGAVEGEIKVPTPFQTCESFFHNAHS